MRSVGPFNYKDAFSRNIGWLSEAEQQSLQGKRVAIAGLGGVGGLHLLTLARLGIGKFTIADPDRFELVNFNRQVGATMQTLGQPKVDVMTRMAREINPEIEIRAFEAEAQDYLVKPVSEARFAATMKRLKTRLSKGSSTGDPSVVVTTARGRLVVPLREIDWIEVRYPTATILGLHWLIWFFAISAITALALRRKFRTAF